jgi:Uma2 family endonuclease
MVDGDPLEEEQMTAAPHPTEPELIDRLIGRDDLTIDDIADLPEDLRYELIEGRLVLTPLAIPVHQLIGKRVGDALEERCPDDFIVNIEQTIVINRRNELHPDVVVLREEAAFISPVLSSDVPLVVEILSRSTKRFDRNGKLEKYASAAIPSYWIVDPLAERVTLTQFILGADGRYEQVLHTDELATVEAPWKVTLDLPAWTAKLERLRRVSRRHR